MATIEEHKKKEEKEKQELKIKAERQRKIIVYSIVGVLGVSLLAFVIMAVGEKKEGNLSDELEVPQTSDQRYNSKLDAVNKGKDVYVKDDISVFDMFEEKEEEKIDSIKIEAELKRQLDSIANLKKKVRYTKQTKQNKRAKKDVYGDYSMWEEKENNNSNQRNIKKDKSIKDIDNSFDAFFSSNPESKKNTNSTNTDSFIYAVIHGNQNITPTQRVKLRLTKETIIGGKLYSRNSYIYAKPNFQTNRVLLNITSVNHIPVDISAYDAEDSSLGIYVEGAEVPGQIAKEGTSDAIDDVDVSGVPIGKAIKNVFKKRHQTLTVTLLNNTKLILKPN